MTFNHYNTGSSPVGLSQINREFLQPILCSLRHNLSEFDDYVATESLVHKLMSIARSGSDPSVYDRIVRSNR